MLRNLNSLAAPRLRPESHPEGNLLTPMICLLTPTSTCCLPREPAECHRKHAASHQILLSFTSSCCVDRSRLVLFWLDNSAGRTFSWLCLQIVHNQQAIPFCFRLLVHHEEGSYYRREVAALVADISALKKPRVLIKGGRPSREQGREGSRDCFASGVARSTPVSGEAIDVKSTTRTWPD